MADSTSASAPAPALPTSARVVIRPLTTREELAACVELQRATWGDSFSDLVPASILKVSQRVGGVAAGAFDSRGQLLGFVFGLTGIEDGRIVHWSDMLAVRADARDLGLGRRLKEYQRDIVRSLGGTVIYWTYDPLVARNAHLNFNKLGVHVVEYVEDMYGVTDSALHRGVGTDRFIVAWPVAVDEADANAARARELGDGSMAATRAAPLLNPDLGDGSTPDIDRIAGTKPPYLRIAIPRDILAIQSRSLDAASRWRASTRRAFHWALSHGYTVGGVSRNESDESTHYVLTRGSRRHGAP